MKWRRAQIPHRRPQTQLNSPMMSLRPRDSLSIEVGRVEFNKFASFSFLQSFNVRFQNVFTFSVTSPQLRCRN
jgi:hypothetical protein